MSIVVAPSLYLNNVNYSNKEYGVVGRILNHGSPAPSVTIGDKEPITEKKSINNEIRKVLISCL